MSAATSVRSTVPTTPSGYRVGDPAYRRILLGLTAGGVANFVLLYYVQPLLPALAQRYAVSAGASAAALSVSTIAMAGTLLFIGPLSDALGRVALMRWSLLAAGLLGMASAFAPTWTTLLVLRAAAGAVLAVVPAVALAYLREEVDPSAHGRANAAYIAGTAIGGAAARLVPIVAEPRLGWSGTTLLAGGVTLAAAVAMWALLPPSRQFRPVGISPRRLVTGTRAAFADPALLGLYVLAAATMGAFVGTYNALGFRLRSESFGAPGASALVYLAYPFGIVAPWLARTAVTRYGRSTVLVVALSLVGAGALVTAVPVLPVIMVGVGLLTVGFFATHSLASGAVVERAQQVRVGTAQASSSYLFAYYVGSAVIGALATQSWERAGWTGVVVTVLAVVIVAGLATVLVRRATVGGAAQASAGALAPVVDEAR